MFLNLVANSNENVIDDEIFESLVSFIISLLDGGNPLIQKTIYKFFLFSSNSEVIFKKFSYIIQVL